MTIMRRVALLRYSEINAATYATGYVAEFSGMDGDHTAKDGENAARAKASLEAAPLRDVRADADALGVAIDAIGMHCSCEIKPYAEVRHVEGCFVQLHDRVLRRLASLRDLLLYGGKERD